MLRLGWPGDRHGLREEDVQLNDGELARTLLYEAAYTLLTRSKKWSTLKAWGMNVVKRRGMAKARVAVA